MAQPYGTVMVGRLAGFFDSEDSYRALADDPEQARWWREVAGPCLAGDPTWHDGAWRLSFDAA
jgi:hypothetical protein